MSPKPIRESFVTNNHNILFERCGKTGGLETGSVEFPSLLGGHITLLMVSNTCKGKEAEIGDKRNKDGHLLVGRELP